MAPYNQVKSNMRLLPLLIYHLILLLGQLWRQREEGGPFSHRYRQYDAAKLEIICFEFYCQRLCQGQPSSISNKSEVNCKPNYLQGDHWSVYTFNELLQYCQLKRIFNLTNWVFIIILSPDWLCNAKRYISLHCSD